LNTKKHYLKRTLCISSIMLTALLAGCNSSSDSSSNNSTKSSELTVRATSPAEDATAVPPNTIVMATFREAMNASTINENNFSLKDADGTVSGTVTVDEASHTAIFTPDSNFTDGTVYTATLTTAIRTAAGSIALAKNKSWDFTGGTAADIDNTSPEVTSTDPADGAGDVAPNRAITANFSEVLDPATVNDNNFTLIETVSNTAVSGAVNYGGTGATFTPKTNLTAGKEYTATLTAGISDLAGNSLVALAVNTWSFKPGSTIVKGPDPVNLGTAGDFAILTKTGITNKSYSVIKGNIGASPITGFAIKPTCDEVVDSTIYGSDAGYKGNGVVTCYKGDSAANTLVANAVLDMGIAYNDAAGRTTPDFTEKYAGDLSAKTLVPGLYKWGTDVLINTDVTLSGGPNDVWIFQIAKNVTLANDTNVILEGGALAKNIFWQVGGGVGVALGTNSHFEGIVLAEKGISVNTETSVNGRLLSHTAVTLQMNAITQPAE
jgi:hypothetical protein